MGWYWYLYEHCSLFKYFRHLYLYVLKIDWQLQIFALVLTGTLAYVMKKKYELRKVTRRQAFAFVNLPVYLVILFSSLVISRPIGGEAIINMNPFWKWIAVASGETKYIQEICLNLAMLVPYGIMFPMATKASLMKTVFTGCILSMLIEVSQFVTKTGLCEVADVMHNTLGVALGYGLLLVLENVYRYIQRNRKLKVLN